jgi:hypothetical protein
MNRRSPDPGRRRLGVGLLVAGAVALVWMLLNPVSLHPMEALKLVFQPGRDIDIFSGYTVRIGAREGDTFTDIRIHQLLPAAAGTRDLVAARGELVYRNETDVLTLTLDEVEVEIAELGTAKAGRVVLTLSNAMERVRAELE